MILRKFHWKKFFVSPKLGKKCQLISAVCLLFSKNGVFIFYQQLWNNFQKVSWISWRKNLLTVLLRHPVYLCLCSLNVKTYVPICTFIFWYRPFFWSHILLEKQYSSKSLITIDQAASLYESIVGYVVDAIQLWYSWL